MQSLRSSPVSPLVGEEIHELDLSSDLSDYTVQALRKLLAERGVIFARNQSLTPERHLALARMFGDVIVNPYFKAVEGYPEIAEVRKEPDQRVNIGEAWHTDNSFDTAPALGSMLLAREVPPNGGDTVFASMYAAYDALSEGLKKTLEPLRAKHTTAHIFGPYGKAAAKGLAGRILTTDAPPREAIHPVVIKHPQSGRKALFVNGTYTTEIEGWTKEESAGLLGFLYQHGTRPEFQCRFQWQTGSIALWDNRCTWHYAANDYHGHRRLMHRIQIEGTTLH